MKRIIRRWLGLKDTHHITCQEMKVFGELLEVTSPCEIDKGDKIEISGQYYMVEAVALRVTRL